MKKKRFKPSGKNKFGAYPIGTGYQDYGVSGNRIPSKISNIMKEVDRAGMAVMQEVPQSMVSKFLMVLHWRVLQLARAVNPNAVRNMLREALKEWDKEEDQVKREFLAIIHEFCEWSDEHGLGLRDRLEAAAAREAQRKVA